MKPLQIIIEDIFTNARYDVKFTSKLIKEMIRSRAGYSFTESEYHNAFVSFRDKTELPICKIWELNKWKYVKSRNKHYVANHNGCLNRVIKVNEARKK